jgi:LPS O-antigen subunit length determinant protein (WzzB/FepE family)
MYGYFRRLFPSPWAEIVTALWFTAIAVGVLLLAVQPSGEFNYGRY